MIDEKKLIEIVNTDEWKYRLIRNPISIQEALSETIESMPRVGEWIPCSERLPECEWGAETEALMYQVGDSIYTGYFGRGGLWRDEYFRRYADIKEGVDASSVIAWMPLPPAYKEGSKNELRITNKADKYNGQHSETSS